MREINRSYSFPSLAVAALLLGSLASVTLASPEESSPPPETREASPGLRAYVDPETGELTSTPSPAQVELLNQALEISSSRSSEDFEQFDLRSGGRGVFLGGRFRSALVIQWSAEGAHEFSCVGSEHETGPEQPSENETAWPDR